MLSCKKQKESKTDSIYSYRSYISGTTNGLISAQSNLAIFLQKPIQEPIDQNALRIEPALAGTLHLENATKLVFKPETKLESDQEYTLSLDLTKLYKDVPETLKSFTFKIKTSPQSFIVTPGALQSYDKDWQYLEGKISLSDSESLEEVKNIVRASQDDKALKIAWEETNISNRYFIFKIDSIQRKMEDDQIKITWNGKSIGLKDTGESSFTIPGKNNFKVVRTLTYQEPEQHIEVNFSDPLNSNQNINGLVRLKDNPKMDVVKDGNSLKIYPKNTIQGNTVLSIADGLKNNQGYTLKANYEKNISFTQLKPAIRLLTNGIILPDAKELKINFESVNLRAVEVRVIRMFEDNVLQFLQNNNLNTNNHREIRKVGRRVAKKTIELIPNPIQNTGAWKSYAIDLAEIIAPQPGAIYRVEISFKQEHSLYNCENATADTDTNEDEDYYYEEDYYYDEEQSYTTQEAKDLEERETQYWDNLIYSYDNYYYSWDNRKNPCHKAYYNEDQSIATNILASNIGVIAKKGSNNTLHFAVSNILTTEPISGANITLYNYQQQAIGKTRTDGDGFALYDADAFAYFAIIEYNNQKSYLKLIDGKALSVSNFNVSGKKLQKGLKGYIYGERGVWRPGDSLHLAFVLQDKNNPIPQGHPIRMEVKDAKGQLVFKQIQRNKPSGLFRFSVPTETDANTGLWSAQAFVGGASFSKRLKVETIKPNRLKLQLQFDEKGALNPEAGIDASLNVAWLHGAPAKNLKADVSVRFYATRTSFKGYEKYHFDDPIREFETEDKEIFEGRLDEKGFASIQYQPDFNSLAPGMLRASFLTKVYENGGDFSIDAYTKSFAPYSSFVGLKMPKGKGYSSYDTDKNTRFEIATVDANGNPVARSKVKVRVYKINWRWWWSSSYDNLASYVGSRSEEIMTTLEVDTNSKGKGAFNLNIDESDRGRYLIRVEDPVSEHVTGQTAYFYKNYWGMGDGNKDAAKMLLFSANKEKYLVGETAAITFPSAENSRALISIENGSEVLSQQWVKTSKGQTTAQIPIDASMTPNVFVSISLLQAHSTRNNDLPLRMYGVIPIRVEDPETRLSPKISMPDVLAPEKNYTVKVSEANGKAMSYTLAIVDEGLLDLTRFKTPNAWDSFNVKEALGVQTWDIYDDVIGAYTGSVEQIYAIGGDADAAAKKGKKANRFKPVVRYVGPFTLKKGESKTHQLQMDKYVGAVRAMVVASNKKSNAYGNAEKSVKVKQPLMVLASLPRKLSPGETVRLPVTVFAMDKKVQNVSIGLELSKGIKVIGAQTQSLNFQTPDEKMAYFDLDVSDAEGINTIKVNANGNGETASFEVEIDVVNPNIPIHKSEEITLEANASKTINLESFGVKGSNQMQITFSTLPPMDFSGRLDYLLRYPHGCVEQTTSSVFPQLFLDDIMDLNGQDKLKTENNIKAGIKRLAKFQTAEGGLSYWIGNRSANDWGTSYAGHFLIEAEKRGYDLPFNLMNNWIKYQKQSARNWQARNSRYYSYDLEQAYRLYTLALVGDPDLSAMNRLREFKSLSNAAKWRLAAAYAQLGKIEVAKDLIRSASISPVNENYRYSYGSKTRNQAMLLESLVLMEDPRSKEISKYLAKKLSSSDWMSTQTTAYALLAMAKIVEKGGGKEIQVQYQLDANASAQINSQKALAVRMQKTTKGTHQLKVDNQRASTVYVKVINSGIPPLGTEVAEARGLRISSTFKEGKNSINPSSLAQGTDFTLEVTVKNQKDELVENIALSQIVPSGWEILNSRFIFGDSNAGNVDYIDYKDDRVLQYFSLKSYESKTFTLQLNASYLGKYYLPGITAEAMYDNDYFVHTKGQWVEVVE